MTDKQIRPFADWLAEQRGGLTHSELSDSFNELVEAVAEHGKVGTITLTVKVKPAGKGAQSTVLISDEIKIRKPEGDRAETIWFVDADGNVVRNNPAQERLPLRQVPTGEIVDTDNLRDAR